MQSLIADTLPHRARFAWLAAAVAATVVMFGVSLARGHDHGGRWGHHHHHHAPLQLVGRC